MSKPSERIWVLTNFIGEVKGLPFPLERGDFEALKNEILRFGGYVGFFLGLVGLHSFALYNGTFFYSL